MRIDTPRRPRMRAPGTSLFAIACTALAPFAALDSAASPSRTADMPPEVASWRERILTPGEYVSLAGRWRAYGSEHPAAAIAKVQESRALRYAGGGTEAERLALLREALRLDPGCPEALSEAATTLLGCGDPLVGSIEEAIAYGERALARAPDWPEPRFGLWTHCVLAGRDAEANEQLRALVRTRAFAPPILDFGYNLLLSAPPHATVFTNGDNDTYPPMALQIASGIRPDVAIVNLSLLNVADYARQAWKRAFGDEGPFTDEELRELAGGPPGGSHASPRQPAERILLALRDKAVAGAWPHPVCFALTVAPDRLDACADRLRIEGIVWRLTRERQGRRPDDEPAIDAARTVGLFRGAFRLDSATDPAHSWGGTDAATRILGNYPAVLRIVATDAAARGDVETVRYAMRTALPLLKTYGEAELAAKFAAYWKELEPGNPEVDRWR